MHAFIALRSFAVRMPLPTYHLVIELISNSFANGCRTNSRARDGGMNVLVTRSLSMTRKTSSVAYFSRSVAVAPR
ncbi:hypothetical protein D3C76_1632500 [compost metagenome]